MLNLAIIVKAVVLTAGVSTQNLLVMQILESLPRPVTSDPQGWSPGTLLAQALQVNLISEV
jgi:hypothetical protein